MFQEWVDRYVQLEMLPTVPIKSLAKFYGFISWKPASWLRNDLAKWYYQLQKDDKVIITVIKHIAVRGSLYLL